MLPEKFQILEYIRNHPCVFVQDVAREFMKPDGSDSRLWYAYINDMEKSELIEYNRGKGDYPTSPISVSRHGEETIEAEKQRVLEAEGKDEKTKRIFRHDWKIAVFSALAGALLSKPLWSGVEFIFTLFFEK